MFFVLVFFIVIAVTKSLLHAVFFLYILYLYMKFASYCTVKFLNFMEAKNVIPHSREYYFCLALYLIILIAGVVLANVLFINLMLVP